MTIWLCRAGLQGQYVNKFINHEKIYLIGNVALDLTGKTDLKELQWAISHAYPTEPDGSVVTMSAQARSFATKVKTGDWVIVPNPAERLLYIGEITGKYDFDRTKSELKHSRTVEWKYGAWERDFFSEDILNSVDAFNSFMMFFKFGKEKRLKDIVSKNKPFFEIGTAVVAAPKKRTVKKTPAKPKAAAAPKKTVKKTPAKPKAAAAEVVTVKKRSVNKPEIELIEEVEPVFAEAPEISEVIAEVRETITVVKKENLALSAEVRKMIMEVREVIDEVRDTITEVRKATIAQSADVKKAIAEVKDATDAHAAAHANAPAAAYAAPASAPAAASAAPAPAAEANAPAKRRGSRKNMKFDPLYWW